MEFITQNGNKKVVINEASFKDAVNLKKAVFKCLKNIDLASLASGNKAVETIINAIINADTSDDFDTSIMACLSSCLYGDIKINENLFNDIPEAREDYYEIISKCAEVNLRPFFKSLVSELKQRLQTLNINKDLA